MEKRGIRYRENDLIVVAYQWNKAESLNATEGFSVTDVTRKKPELIMHFTEQALLLDVSVVKRKINETRSEMFLLNVDELPRFIQALRSLKVGSPMTKFRYFLHVATRLGPSSKKQRLILEPFRALYIIGQEVCISVAFEQTYSETRRNSIESRVGWIRAHTLENIDLVTPLAKAADDEFYHETFRSAAIKYQHCNTVNTMSRGWNGLQGSAHIEDFEKTTSSCRREISYSTLVNYTLASLRRKEWYQVLRLTDGFHVTNWVPCMTSWRGSIMHHCRAIATAAMAAGGDP